ncbi:MAG: DUF1175 family protein, partial [Leptospirales bacterium]
MMHNTQYIFLSYLFVFTFASHCNASSAFKNRIHSSLTRYPADGSSGGKLVFEKSFFDEDDYLLPVGSSEEKYIEVIKKEINDNDETWFFKSRMEPGIVRIKTEKGLSLEFVFYETSNDIDEDNFPDSAELNNQEDRKKFTDWFVRIAEAQYLKKNYAWNKNERDCSGLIRYAYREALKKHDEKWQQKYGILLDKNLPDVQKFNYPDVPVLKQNLFKISNDDAKTKTSFSAYADAEHLVKYNTKFISKNIEHARKGDLLFFFDENNVEYPYHS